MLVIYLVFFGGIAGWLADLTVALTVFYPAFLWCQVGLLAKFIAFLFFLCLHR